MSMNAAEWSIDFSEIGTRLGLADKAGANIGTAVDGGMGNVTLGDEALNSNFGIQTGTSWLYRTAQKALYQSNGGGRNFGVFNAKAKQLITLDISAAPTPTNATLKSTNGNVRVYEVTADGTVTFNLARYNYIYTISVADPSATDVEYTVKYVDEEGIELKASSTNSGAPGAAITVGDVEKASFVAEGQKYIYKSDDAADKTIAADGTTVVTVTFRKAASYTLFAKYNGNVISFAAVYEGDNGNVYVPYYQLVDGKLYGTPKVDKGTLSYGQVTVSNVAADVDVNVSYTEDATQNAVFFAEAENISTLKAYEDGFTNIRMSNGAVGYAEADGAVIVNLPAGKYTVTSASRSGTTDFYAGTTQVLEVVSTGSVVTTTGAEFTLTKATDITVNAGSTSAYFDYVLVRKTGEYVAPDNTIEAGKYAVTATVAKVVENIPEAFEKYVGEYETKATIEGDATSLVITENAEEGIFSGFEIVGDAVEFSADKTITLGGKTFTVRAKDDDAVNGSLAITAGENEGEYKMADADIYYNGVKAATVTNIKMTLVTAPAVADFEDFTVDPETGLYQPEDEENEICYWNSGDFTFTTYTDDWDTKYYYDFVGTNSKSSEYKGLADQYNSSVGGAKSGDNYVVWYSNYYGSEGIYCPDAMKVSGFYVTNTAWVVDAILNGDGMSIESDGTKGKPFGYKDAEDKLTLVVTGYDLEGEETGKVEYTLAEVKDGYVYYVKAWRWVDLTTLGDNVVNVQFAINSTKCSDYGATTPSYFCMDDFNGVAPEVDADMEKVEITAVQNVSAASKTTKIAKFMKNGKIVIMKNGKQYNVAGQEM